MHHWHPRTAAQQVHYQKPKKEKEKEKSIKHREASMTKRFSVFLGVGGQIMGRFACEDLPLP